MTAIIIWCCTMALAPASDAVGADYHDAESLLRAMQAMAARSRAAALEPYGESRQSKPLWVLTLAAAGGRPAAERTAVLLVAGIDGDHLVGSETALRVADKLLEGYEAGEAAARALLTEYTVYVIPRANPDAQERYFATTADGSTITHRPIDDDRDGASDEDGPDDVDGDGFITLMRAVDPRGSHLADADEPRLMRKADPAKGELVVYKLYVEGLDNDGDGEYNEDPAGGVDLNANFPHGYQEHETNRGPFQLCEPESRALIDFVLGHSRIAAVLTYGRHNNLIEVDDGGKKDQTDEAPIELHKDDVAFHQFMGERFKELTGVRKSSRPSTAGSFFAWAYAHYGIPSFATSVWSRPEPEKPDKKGRDEEPDDRKGGEAAETTNGEDAKPEHPLESDEGGEKPRSDEAKKKKDKKKDMEFEEDIAWLKYCDESRGGEGFVAWHPAEHPTLGSVEIGGFAPYFRQNPPASELNALAEAQLKFAMEVGSRLAKVSLEAIEVVELGTGVFEIKALLRNTGQFPSGLAIAKQNRRVRPIVAEIEAEPEGLLGGHRIHKVWNIDGGGSYELRWAVRGRRGEKVTIHVTSEKYGNMSVEVPLSATPAGANGGGR